MPSEISTGEKQVPIFHDFRLLLILFIGLRLVILVAYDTGQLAYYGELDIFYQYGELTAITGKLPYIGLWMEYPPLFVWPNLAIYTVLITWLGLGQHAYYTVMALIFLLADIGNLVLIRKIGTKIYGTDRGMGLAWCYALLGFPLVQMVWNYEPLVTFYMLLGLWLLLDHKETGSAFAVAAGALTKVFPGFLVPVVWRFRERRDAIRFTAIVAGCGVLAYLPFLIISPEYAIASLRALSGKSSWNTIWALIDGNTTMTGNFGMLGDRLDLSKATQFMGNPPVIPPWVTLLVFGALYVFLFTRPMRKTDRALVAFLGVTWCVFLLWSRGWSTPWTQMIIPLILIVFPDREGVLAAVLFSLVNLVEWPLLLSRGLWWGMYITVPLRTLIVAGLLIAFYRQTRAVEPAGGEA